MISVRLVGAGGRAIAVDADGGLVLAQPKDFFLEVARGNIPGMTPVEKFGRNPDVDTGTDPEDIWDVGGLWVKPTQARIHNIVSASVNDAAAGTGARTIRVIGLVDWHKVETSEDVILNGQSNVPTKNAYVVIHRMKVLTWGSGGVAAGTITATAETDSTVTAQITQGQDQTLMAVYAVPSLQKLYLTQWYIDLNRGGSAGTVDCDLLIDPSPDQPNSGYQTKSHLGLQSTGSSHIEHSFKPYFKIPGPALVVSRAAMVSANNTDVSAGFDGILVDN